MADDNPEELLDELNKLDAAWQAAKAEAPKGSLLPDATYRLVIKAKKLDKSPQKGTLRYGIKVAVNMPDSAWHNKDFWHNWYLTENTAPYVKRDFALMGVALRHTAELASLSPEGTEFDAFVSFEEYEAKNEPPDPGGNPVMRRKNVIKYFKEPRGGPAKGAQAAQAQAGAGKQDESDPF